MDTLFIPHVTHITVSDGNKLISRDDNKIKIWDMKTGRCTKTIEAHSHFVTCIAFNAGNPVVATGSVDQTVKIWAPYR